MINTSEILGFFKKLSWFVLIVFIIFNVVIFHYFNGLSYLLWLVFGNTVLFYLLSIVVFLIGKKYLVTKTMEVVNDVNEKIKDETGVDIQEAVEVECTKISYKK